MLILAVPNLYLGLQTIFQIAVSLEPGFVFLLCSVVEAVVILFLVWRFMVEIDFVRALEANFYHPVVHHPFFLQRYFLYIQCKSYFP